jgi:hypothetical protein
MGTKNTGGPAFPVKIKVTRTGNTTTYHSTEQQHEGMTLRDYFAARAMQGIIGTQPYPDGIVTAGIAGDAYAIADAMLKTREQ